MTDYARQSLNFKCQWKHNQRQRAPRTCDSVPASHAHLAATVRRSDSCPGTNESARRVRRPSGHRESGSKGLSAVPTGQPGQVDVNILTPYCGPITGTKLLSTAAVMAQNLAGLQYTCCSKLPLETFIST
jgi:hypothetical protein